MHPNMHIWQICTHSIHVLYSGNWGMCAGEEEEEERGETEVHDVEPVGAEQE